MAMSNKLECPHCGGTRLIAQSLVKMGPQKVRRYRRCEGCGLNMAFDERLVAKGKFYGTSRRDLLRKRKTPFFA